MALVGHRDPDMFQYSRIGAFEFSLGIWLSWFELVYTIFWPTWEDVQWQPVSHRQPVGYKGLYNAICPTALSLIKVAQPSRICGLPHDLDALMAITRNFIFRCLSSSTISVPMAFDSLNRRRYNMKNIFNGREEYSLCGQEGMGSMLHQATRTSNQAYWWARKQALWNDWKPHTNIIQPIYCVDNNQYLLQSCL